MAHLENENRPKRRRRPRKAGNIATAQKVLWGAILAAEATLKDAEGTKDVLRCVHALTQASGAYARLFEASELAERLDRLEREIEELRPGRTLRAA